MIKPTKNILALVAAIGLIAFVISYYGSQTAFAGFNEPASQTVPTRTPVPAPTNPPPPTEKPKENNNNNNPPPPTNTPVATPTATLPPVTFAPTPIGGIINPDRCGEPYFIASLGTVNVRSLPSTDGEVITQMVYLEARQILARAADVAWWQILLPDTSTGWVFDSTGSMVGMMESVPVLNSDGSPAPEPLWQPTPDLFCPTVTPSPIPTETATPPPTEAASATPIPTNTPAPTVTAVAIAESGDSDPVPTPMPDPSIISPLPDEVEAIDSSRNKRPAPELSESSDFSAESNTNSSTAAEPPSSSGGINWPIVVGVGLILVGFAALLFQRRQGVQEE